MWYPPNYMPQYPPQEMIQVDMDERWIEEQKDTMKQMLVSRGIPESICEYYIEAPKDWEGDDVDEKGVHIGVRNILMSQRSVKPWWVRNSSLKMMAELKLKFTRVVQAIEEVIPAKLYAPISSSGNDSGEHGRKMDRRAERENEADAGV